MIYKKNKKSVLIVLSLAHLIFIIPRREKCISLEQYKFMLYKRYKRKQWHILSMNWYSFLELIFPSIWYLSRTFILMVSSSKNDHKMQLIHKYKLEYSYLPYSYSLTGKSWWAHLKFSSGKINDAKKLV